MQNMKTNPDNVKIIQISAISDTSGDDYVYGLGDDGLVYRWSYNSGKWEHYSVTD